MIGERGQTEVEADFLSRRAGDRGSFHVENKCVVAGGFDHHRETIVATVSSTGSFSPSSEAATRGTARPPSETAVFACVVRKV